MGSDDDPSPCDVHRFADPLGCCRREVRARVTPNYPIETVFHADHVVGTKFTLEREETLSRTTFEEKALSYDT